MKNKESNSVDDQDVTENSAEPTADAEAAEAEMVAEAEAVLEAEETEEEEDGAALSAGRTEEEDQGGEADEADADGIEPDTQQIALILRMTEALLFASDDPADVKTLAARLPKGADVKQALVDLQELYKNRGVNLICVGGKWGFRTAPDLSYLMEEEREETRRLSKAAVETLAIIAYHQPVTRAEIEDIRGVAVSKGTLDLLMEAGWVKPKGRRRVPGRPLTYGTSESFLEHFGLESVQALPGLDDLKAAGLLEARLPPDFDVPDPARAEQEAELDPIDEEDDDLSDTLFEDEDGDDAEEIITANGEADEEEPDEEEPGEGEPEAAALEDDQPRAHDAVGEVGAVANDNLDGPADREVPHPGDVPLRKPVPLRG